MTWIAIGTPPFTDIATFDEVTATLGGSPTAWRPAGSASVGDELRVVMVWSSREQAERFFADVLRPAVAAKVGPDRKPGLVGFAAEREYRAELVSP